MLHLTLLPMLGLAALLGGCSGADERPDPLSPDIEKPPETPPDKPPEDIPTGDGTHRIQAGNAIQAANGIRITLNVQPRKAGADRPEYTHDLVFSATLRNDPTLLTDYPSAVMVEPDGSPSVSCFKIQEAVQITVLEADLESDPPEVLIEIRSLLSEPLQHRTEIAEHCLKERSGDVEGCSAAIPDAPFSFETQFGDSYIAVQSPYADYDDLAELRVRQVRECTDAISSWLGITPSVNTIGYRLFSDIRPQTSKSVRATPYDPLAVACHELTHLHVYGANIPLWMNEGIAQYVEEHLPLSLKENLPWPVVDAFDAPLDTQNAYLFQVSDIDPFGETIAVTTEDSPAETFDVPVPGAFATPTHHIAVAEKTDSGKVSFSIYDDVHLSNGLTARTTCREGSVRLHNAIAIDDQRLVPFVDALNTPFEADYASVATSEDPVAIYGGGTCFWNAFIDQYGEGKLREIFSRLHAQRSRITEGKDEPWCLMPLFVSVVGEDVRSLLTTFGADEETMPCRPPRVAWELVPPQDDPASADQCETSILAGTHL